MSAHNEGATTQTTARHNPSNPWCDRLPPCTTTAQLAVIRLKNPLLPSQVAAVSHSSSRSESDPEKAQQFAGRLLRALNDGSLCLMASIGHRTGLFDALRDQPPLTSAEIADRAGLHERYVREWLGAMVTAAVVIVDPRTLRFSLPAEHAAFLTRAVAADNIAVFTQYIALLGSVEDDIVECFRNGGGVPYAKFPRFHAVMAEDSGQSVMSSLESHIIPLVPGLADRLTSGIRMLDVGCGRGRILIRLAEMYPGSSFVGMDLSNEAIQDARDEASSRGLGNLEFAAMDLSDFHEQAEPDSFDCITTFDAVHDQAQPLNVLKGIYRSLRSNGVYIMQDIKGSSHVYNNLEHPIGTFLYTVSCMHCMTVSLAQGGEGLGAMWGEEKTREYLERAGFRSVVKHELAHDIQNNWYVVGK
ncbi:MAG: methyltransferase domain-containing protein [Anaerolineae bacterium]|nr:methyltransferase domain-containing protein [Gemmatimonadaceae bacterium]